MNVEADSIRELATAEVQTFLSRVAPTPAGPTTSHGSKNAPAIKDLGGSRTLDPLL